MIYIAILISNNISKRIKSVLIGTQKIKNKEFGYQLKINKHDEIGALKNSFNEMAKSIQALHSELELKLYIDDLTNLKNRNSFLRDIKKYDDPLLFILDIDSFKNINDYYGVRAGNFILVEFGILLETFCKDRGIKVYRMGSDDYLLLKGDGGDKDTATSLIKDINKKVKKRRFVDSKSKIDTVISFTSGISYGKDNLLEKADLALNEAKRKKISYMVYDYTDPHMNRHEENILWKEKLIYAIKNDKVVPFFQEIISIGDSQNKKYEALIRIVDDGNIITPYRFLNIAKETKLYPELTKIMIEKTFKIFDKNSAMFSLNITVDDILNSDTVKFMHKMLQKYNVSERLIFELLESEEISSFYEIMPFIEEMKKIGVRFAIDDFGSGYSNFSYLLQIKPDYIKIDGSLIKNLTKESNEYHIVNAIVTFAKSLNIKIIAEHVSSQEIVEVLSDFDIDYMQGFHFSEPSEKLN